MTRICLDKAASATSEERVPDYPDASKIPFLTSPTALRTLTHTRIKQLRKAASQPWDQPPVPPGLSDCCGSACDPCVKDLWKEELRCWQERWGSKAIKLGIDGKPDITKQVKSGEESANKLASSCSASDEDARKMPGAFLDW